MDKIRIQNEVKKIEVNDNGDYISVPVNDVRFIRNFHACYEKWDKAKKKLDNSAASDTGEMLNILVDTVDGFVDDIDLLFGKGSCDKIFGGYPSADGIADFFAQFMPIFERLTNQEKENSEKRIRKYTKQVEIEDGEQ